MHDVRERKAHLEILVIIEFNGSYSVDDRLQTDGILRLVYNPVWFPVSCFLLFSLQPS